MKNVALFTRARQLIKNPDAHSGLWDLGIDASNPPDFIKKDGVTYGLARWREAGAGVRAYYETDPGVLPEPDPPLQEGDDLWGAVEENAA